MPIVDFSQATELVPVPVDTYDAILESWEYHPSAKSSGQPYLSLKFAVSGGDFDGRTLFRNFSLQAKALWAFKRALVRLGANSEDLTEEMDLDDVMPPLVGAMCKLKVGQREYTDPDTEEVRVVNDVQDILSAYSFASSTI